MLNFFVDFISESKVRYNDQMKLESVKTPGQFLNCGAKQIKSAEFDTNPHLLVIAKLIQMVYFITFSFELNLSATESAVTLLAHHSLSTKHPKQSLRVRNCFIFAQIFL